MNILISHRSCCQFDTIIIPHERLQMDESCRYDMSAISTWVYREKCRMSGDTDDRTRESGARARCILLSRKIFCASRSSTRLRLRTSGTLESMYRGKYRESATCSLHRVPIDHVRQLSLRESLKFAIGVIKMTSRPSIWLIYKANVNGSFN